VGVKVGMANFFLGQWIGIDVHLSISIGEPKMVCIGFLVNQIKTPLNEVRGRDDCTFNLQNF